MKLINLLAAFALLFFIGCGGGSKEQPTEDSAQQKDPEITDVRTIDIIGVDQMKFVVEENAEGITLGEAVGPDSLRRLTGITAEPGQRIRIRLTTRSKLPAVAMSHNWLLLTLNADAETFATAAAQSKENNYVPADMEDQVIAQTGMVAGGESAEIILTVPEEPGEYEFICTFPGHFLSGMRGTLTVKEKDTSASS